MRVAHILIFGKVQGIGFRKFAKEHARRLELVGWVRNLPEGTVEVEVAGESNAIDVLIELCQKGPFLSEVKSVDVSYEEKNFPFASFDTRHDIE